MVRIATMAKNQKNGAKSGKKKCFTLIRLSEIVNAKCRLEAASFGIDFRAVRNRLQASGLNLKNIYGEDGLCHEIPKSYRLKRIYVGPSFGVSFLSSSDIIGVRGEADKYVSRKLTTRLSSILVQKWDVMISRSGTIGNVALAGNRFAGSALSEDAMRARTEKPEMAGYVSAFLRSRYGRPQLIGSSYGSVVTHIEPEHLGRILIPDLHPMSVVKIGRWMMEATEQRDEANNLLDEANRVLHERLGLKSVNSLPSGEGEVHYRRLHASELAGRFEGSYHAPVVRSMESELNKSEVEMMRIDDPIMSEKIIAVTKFRKRIYVSSGGIPMMSSKQIFQVDPVDVKRLARGAHEKDLPEITLRENMLVITCSGTIGRVHIVPKYMEGWTANQHALRVVPAGCMNPGYLYAWLASDYGYKLLTRNAYGSVILEIDKEMLGSIPVPMPSLAIRNEIGEFVLRANALRDEAWRLERRAIEEIESIIEKGKEGVVA